MGGAPEGVETGLAGAKAVVIPAGCNAALLAIWVEGVGVGFVSLFKGLLLSSGGAGIDSFNTKPTGCRMSFVGTDAIPFALADVTVGVGGAGECTAVSCNDLAIKRFNVSTESKGRDGIACSFNVFPLYKSQSQKWSWVIVTTRRRDRLYKRQCPSFFFLLGFSRIGIRTVRFRWSGETAIPQR